MITAHMNPLGLLVGGVTSPKKVTLVDKIIEVKQIVPIKVTKTKQFAARDDGLIGVMVWNVCVKWCEDISRTY